MMIGAATVLSVSDMTKSVEHYCNALGFAITYGGSLIAAA
jgi:hypothetical protein